MSKTYTISCIIATDFQQESSHAIGGHSDGGGDYYLDAAVRGTPGSTKVLTFVDDGAGGAAAQLHFSAVSGAAVWIAGTYTLRLNVTAKSNSGDVITISNAAAVTGVDAGTVASWSGSQAVALGINSYSVTGVAWPGADPAAVIDFKFPLHAVAGAIGHTITVTADQIITAPFGRDLT